MENTLHSSPLPRSLIMPAVFAGIYALGAGLFVTNTFGYQTVPGFSDLKGIEWGFALLCLLGAVSNVAILRGRRWGVVGQIVMWVANSVVNIALDRIEAGAMGLALILVALWCIDVFRNRSSLR